MGSITDLKIEGRRHEAAGRFEEATQCYLRALREARRRDELAVDPSLYLRVADLYVRRDEHPVAMDYYWQSAHAYAEQGLITNAIAVCNRILRVAGEDPDAYRSLALYHLDVGLVAEARKLLGRYLEARPRESATEEATETLVEFLERSPSQALAALEPSFLRGLDRMEEAAEALRRVWEARVREHLPVDAIEERLLQLDPELDPGRLRREVESEMAREEASRTAGPEGAEGEGEGTGRAGSGAVGSGREVPEGGEREEEGGSGAGAHARSPAGGPRARPASGGRPKGSRRRGGGVDAETGKQDELEELELWLREHAPLAAGTAGTTGTAAAGGGEAGGGEPAPGEPAPGELAPGELALSSLLEELRELAEAGRRQFRAAVELLARAVEEADGDDGEMAEFLEFLALALDDLGEKSRAVLYLERLEALEDAHPPARRLRLLRGDGEESA